MVTPVIGQRIKCKDVISAEPLNPSCRFSPLIFPTLYCKYNVLTSGGEFHSSQKGLSYKMQGMLLDEAARLRKRQPATYRCSSSSIWAPGL